MQIAEHFPGSIRYVSTSEIRALESSYGAKALRGDKSCPVKEYMVTIALYNKDTQPSQTCSEGYTFSDPPEGGLDLVTNKQGAI